MPPLDAVGICRELEIVSDKRRLVRETLHTLESRGEIIRVRKRFFTLPSPGDHATGRIFMRRNGTATLLEETSGGTEIFLSETGLGTALHGDRVVVQIERRRRPDATPSSQRARQSRDLHGPARHPDKTDSGDPVESRRSGRVLRILERANTTVVGTLQRDGSSLVLLADDPRFPHRIEIVSSNRMSSAEGNPETRDACLPGKKAVVALHPWESRRHPLEGELIEILGPADGQGVETLAILRRFKLSETFSDAVLAEAESITDPSDCAAQERREDLRSQPTLTIDPEDARDFDDAIHVEATREGWLLSVHIADVAHYVKPGSALDMEARHRGNSTYLADRVIPMLPERLSNGVCSLKPGVDRLAHTAFLNINSRGKVTSARFARTIIRSIARLTYPQALAILEDAPPERLARLPPVPEGSRCFTDREVQKRVQTAWELARLLRKNRFAAGSLDLDFPEIKVRLDPEGRPVGMEKIENDISHQLVEECMLAANEAVAAAVRRSGASAVYRIHETPDPLRLREFRDKVASHGRRCGDLSLRSEIQRLLANLRGSPEEYVLKLDFLKSLKRATYDVRPLGHYGLAKQNYTHFTSPIRRYADLLVHRVLAGEKPPSARLLGETAVHISATERNSADAEKQSVQRKKIAFFEYQLRARQPRVFDAVVTGIRPHGLQIELPEVLLSGMIPLRALSEDRYWYDEAQGTLRGKRSGKCFARGSALRVIVSRVDAQKGFVDFCLAPEPDSPGSPQTTPSRTGSKVRRNTSDQKYAPARSRHRKTQTGFRKKRD